MDGTSFTHKVNRFHKVRTEKTIAWRMLQRYSEKFCSLYGRNVMWKGCNAQEQYNGRNNVVNLFVLLLEHFLSMLKKRSNSNEKHLLRDDEFLENSVKVIST